MEIVRTVSLLISSGKEIVKAVYKGQKYKDLAKDWFVEEVTIRGHVTKILK